MSNFSSLEKYEDDNIGDFKKRRVKSSSGSL